MVNIDKQRYLYVADLILKCDFVDWIGQRIKVVLLDGYTKYGLLSSEDTLFVEITYEKGRGAERIAKSQIASIKLSEGRE